MPSVDLAAAIHASRHAAGGPDEITPAAIGAATTTSVDSVGAIAAQALASVNTVTTRFRTGTGSPQGVVSAPVGTEYTDTAGTNGAWTWLKTSGTGNTGWTVTYGDTGDRNISSLLINGWAPSNSNRWTMRRMNSTVYIGGYITGPSSTSDDIMSPIPTGFYGYDATGSWREFSSSGKEGVVLVQRGSRGIITLRGATGGVNIFTSVTFTTNDAWPTTLPGLPA